MSLIIGGAMCALGGLLLVSGVNRGVTALTLYRNAATPVRKVAQTDGPVEFDGIAEPSADTGGFAAPFSGNDALCYQVWMETRDEYRTDADGVEPLGPEKPEKQDNTRSSSLLAETGELRRPFVVRDGGARVEVDPTDATLNITGHMGETVVTVDTGDALPDEVRNRLLTLDQLDTEFDADHDRWDRPSDRVRYREARLEPGEPVHVADAVVESRPDEWGSGIDASVGGPQDGGPLTISEGTESSVIRQYTIQFATGLVFGTGLLAIGFHVLGLMPLF
jgi:hypothetical protein